MLSNDAPSDQVAVGDSVESHAPAEVGGSDEGSGAPNDRLIPVERFNGLMSRFNQTQAELESLRQQMAERDATPPAQPQEDTNNMSDVSALQEQIAALQTMLMQRETDTVRDKALEKYPNAKHFAHLIVGSTPEDIEYVARSLHESFEAATGSTSTPPGSEVGASTEQPPASAEAPAAPSETPVAPEAPVTGGAVTYQGNPSFDDAIRDAKANRDFGALMAAKRAKILGDQGLTE